ncbi:MerR family DNA-binding protein [Lysobacter enzymogenes]|uniref:MerR family DNA-binding protein n=1 Tax=Lysobacter enzymogenes TaxID=69 RepID=UPI001A979AF3|nr:MerR family DNA-binding protein [Lysobacter enzymogenes]
MKIGEFAQRVGVGIDTVRYYERQGLLPLPTRQMSGYRRFESKDVARLQFVRRAKNLGFTLAEIRELLALLGSRGSDMAGVNAATTQKLADVEAKIAELSHIRDLLQVLLDSCPGRGAVESCPIVNALEGEQHMSGSHPLDKPADGIQAPPRSCCSAARTCETEAAANQAVDAVDPVCGMQVNIETASHQAVRAGVDYYFCSAQCRQEFLAAGASAAR